MSVTFTVKVHVPAAVGVPLTTMVGFVAVTFAAVKPVVPALKAVTFTVVYGVVPLLTMIVWFVAVPAVACTNAAGAMLSALFTVSV
jgi:hypothetical protein